MRILRKSGDVPRRSLWQRIKDVALTDVAVIARGGVSAGSLERLEELLLEADFGVPTTLRLVAEARAEDPDLSMNAAVLRIGPRVGVNPDTLRGWVKQTAIDRGERPGTTTTDAKLSMERDYEGK